MEDRAVTSHDPNFPQSSAGSAPQQSQNNSRGVGNSGSAIEPANAQYAAARRDAARQRFLWRPADAQRTQRWQLRSASAWAVGRRFVFRAADAERTRRWQLRSASAWAVGRRFVFRRPMQSAPGGGNYGAPSGAVGRRFVFWRPMQSAPAPRRVGRRAEVRIPGGQCRAHPVAAITAEDIAARLPVAAARAGAAREAVRVAAHPAEDIHRPGTAAADKLIFTPFHPTPHSPSGGFERGLLPTTEIRVEEGKRISRARTAREGCCERDWQSGVESEQAPNISESARRRNNSQCEKPFSFSRL